MRRTAGVIEPIAYEVIVGRSSGDADALRARCRVIWSPAWSCGSEKEPLMRAIPLALNAW